jgi:hypothetical protein
MLDFCLPLTLKAQGENGLRCRAELQGHPPSALKHHHGDLLAFAGVLGQKLNAIAQAQDLPHGLTLLGFGPNQGSNHFQIEQKMTKFCGMDWHDRVTEKNGDFNPCRSP